MEPVTAARSGQRPLAPWARAAQALIIAGASIQDNTGATVRLRTAVTALTGAAALTVALAGSAQAADGSIFGGQSTNNASYASVRYHYENVGSSYTAYLEDIKVGDLNDGDGWGSSLVVHSDQGVLREYRVHDSQFHSFGDDPFYRVSGVWFSICNWNEATDALNSCVRLTKGG
ncbi:hypothetical protein GCM10009647_070600 [Streptomyces sanglieri]